MPLSDATHIGRLSAQAEALQEDIRDLRKQADHSQDRLREVETAVSLMVEAQRDARRREETQYRRIEARLQMLMIIATVAGVAGPIALVLVHH